MLRSLLLLALVTGCAETWPAPRAQAPNYDVPLHGRGEFLRTPQGRLYYEVEGHGPPLVLVAGGPGASHAHFHPRFSALAARHTVIYFDNLGRGRSDRLADPRQYTVERDADDIEALRQALGFERISVLGQSYGGMPALAYALKYPQHLERLVLSDTLLGAKGFQDNIDSANFNARSLYPEEWARLMALRAQGVRSGDGRYQDLYGRLVGDLYWYDPAKAALVFRSGDPADALNRDVYRAMVGDDPEWTVSGTLAGYDPGPQLAALRAPTLICVGRADRVATPAMADDLRRALPAGQATLVVFEHSSHHPAVEEGDRYFAVLSAFLEGRPLPGP